MALPTPLTEKTALWGFKKKTSKKVVFMKKITGKNVL